MTLTCIAFIEDGHRCTISSTGECPHCKQAIRIWSVNKRPDQRTDSDMPEVFMYPAGQHQFSVQEFPSEIPEPLRRAFLSTVASFNSNNFPATATGARRTLEGIFKYRLPEELRRGNLAQLINRTTESVDLAEPLGKLAHAIRDGGNLGAHFDMEKEPTEEMAKHMVELLNYLISYLYVLPKEIEKLEQSLQRDADAADADG